MPTKIIDSSCFGLILASNFGRRDESTADFSKKHCGELRRGREVLGPIQGGVEIGLASGLRAASAVVLAVEADVGQGVGHRVLRDGQAQRGTP